MSSVSIVVISDNRRATLERCLRSCLQQTGIDSIFLVAPQMPLNYPSVTWIEGKNSLSTGAKRQLGVTASQSEWIFFLDDDCAFAEPDHVSKMVARARLLGEDYAVGAYSNFAHTKLPQKAYNHLTNLWLTARPHHVTGGNLLTHRSVFARARFDSHMHYAQDDRDFGEQLVRHGYKGQYFAELQVSHDSNMSWRAFFKKAVLHGQALKAAHLQSSRVYFSAFKSFFSRDSLPLLGPIFLFHAGVLITRIFAMVRPRNDSGVN